MGPCCRVAMVTESFGHLALKEASCCWSVQGWGPAVGLLWKKGPSAGRPQVPFPVPQAAMVFRGRKKEKKEVPETLISNLRIHYPLPGSSALVSFEDAGVANGLLRQREHRVPLEKCRLPVRLQPVELPVPTAIKVLTWLCREKVLIIGLPPALQLGEEQLLDKLELFFSKPSNGGGEVKTRELLPGAAVLSFADDPVAQRLTSICHFSVPLGPHLVPLRVFPYVNGKIQEIEIKCCPAPHSVLVRDIPDILDAEELLDVLEIHFQKPSQGGGEVEALVCVAPGTQKLALFTPVSG
ncbi:interferon-induced 35 kDa protein isoform X2 [Sarcophilus harrisii]|uniref:Interferon induced protein 35 n=1 Tax=Sarcophilus harrisii TaxID=9305 RepID=G3WET5_SARHA|nr:interferon-induced 35 kDa protein isoform X2 [Sarcophilus harrisii]